MSAMTRTEERLRDALGAAAAQVDDDRLRPLAGPAPEARQRRPGRLRGHRAFPGWLAPVAAALSVLLVVALAMSLTRGGRHPARPSDGYPLPAGFPRYVADIYQDGVAVRSTSTGAVVTTAMTPDVPGWQLFPQAVAAAPDDRSFYIAYDASDETGAQPRQIWIYQLTWSHGGSANSLSWIRGNPVPGSDVLAIDGSMAVSPDGTRLALTAASPARVAEPDSRVWPDEIIVIDLRTGTRSVWRGGLSHPGRTFTVPGLAWAPDSRSLVFRAIWCRPVPNTNQCADTPGRLGYRGTQVRSLDAAAGGGTLSRSTVLLAQSARYPDIADAVPGPRGELTLAVLSGSPDAARLTVERVTAARGSEPVVLYRSRAYGTAGLPDSVTLGLDAAGRYLTLTYPSGAGYVSGWIDHGILRFLPAEHPGPGLVITAW